MAISSSGVIASDDAASSSASSADDGVAHSVTATTKTTPHVKVVADGAKVQLLPKMAAAMAAVAAPGSLEAESERKVAAFTVFCRCPQLSRLHGAGVFILLLAELRFPLDDCVGG